MRLAIGGIRHETNTFSTLHTGIEDFEVKRGDEVLEEGPWDSFGRVEWAPTLLAYALPHGLVQRAAFTSLRDELIDRLRSTLPVDGIYLDLHGAMEVEEVGEGEGNLVEAVREVAGDEIPIVASLDLHGNISHMLARTVDVLTAFRTAPHRDEEETRRRAVRHLMRCVDEGLRPRNVLLKLPLLLPGEYAVTDIDPAKSLYGQIASIEREEGLLDASIMIGCAWGDSARSCVSVIVVSDGERSKPRAHEHAVTLGRAIWDRRRIFGPHVETMRTEEAIAKATGADGGPIFISDSGDNVTAGGAGDIPIVLEQLLSSRVAGAVVAGITDPEAVSICEQAGVGSEVSLQIGGKLDRVNGHQLPVRGIVRHVVHARLAVLETDGVKVVLISGRWPFATRKNFEEAGIDPRKEKLIVVKLGYLFSETRDLAKTAIMALSPGFTSLQIEKFPYERISRPMYPLDKDCEFYEVQTQFDN